MLAVLLLLRAISWILRSALLSFGPTPLSSPNIGPSAKGRPPLPRGRGYGYSLCVIKLPGLPVPVPAPALPAFWLSIRLTETIPVEHGLAQPPLLPHRLQGLQDLQADGLNPKFAAPHLAGMQWEAGKVHRLLIHKYCTVCRRFPL